MSVTPRHSHKLHKLVSALAIVVGLMAVCTLAPVAQPAFAAQIPSGTYVVQVGYHEERGGQYSTVIRDKATWDSFLSSMGTRVWTDDGSYVRMPSGFADYDKSFFANNKLAVAYAGLGSVGYSPQITSVTQSGGTLSLTYGLGIRPDTLYPAAMGGFVAVSELPASSPVTTVSMVMGEEGGPGAQGDDAEPWNTSNPDAGKMSVKKKTAVTPSAKALSMACKSSKTLKATVKGADGQRVTSPAVTYASKNAKVATVDKSGNVTAKLPGKASIVIRFPGSSAYEASSATVAVTVSKRSSGFTKTSAKSVSVKHSQVKRATVAVSPIAKPKHVYASKGVTYSKVSGRGSIKVNSKTGKVTVGKGTPKGKYVIKAKVSNKADSCCKASSQTLTFRVTIR